MMMMHSAGSTVETGVYLGLVVGLLLTEWKILHVDKSYV